MRRALFFLMSIVFMTSLSSDIFAQWAQNKHAREDAIYARYLQESEDVIIDGVEDPIWAMADSVVVGYGQTSYLPGSGYDLWAGQSVPSDSANAVFKCLFKAPYLYFLFKVDDKYVGGKDWSQFDAIIMALKENTADHSWVQAWDKRIEHFYTWGYTWAFPDSFPVSPVGAPPLYMGNNAVAGGKDEWRTAAQIERWTATTGVNGISNDSLPDDGWVSEHRIRVDSLGFDLNGDILPFSFSMFDADGYLDENSSNDAHTRTWWGCPWNENWYYAALFIDPNVTTGSPGGVIPPVDYIIPHLRDGQSITTDGDLSDWQTDNALHFRAKWQDEAGFDSIKGTGAWASGYQQLELVPGSLPTVIDGPEVDYWVTYDDENMYVGAHITDQIVTVPYSTGQKDGISFFMTPRNYVNGNGIFPSKTLTVNVDSTGAGQAADDLISLVDTAGVEFSLALGSNTTINDPNDADDGYSVEIKIPFTAFSYPTDLGDSVVFIGALVNDLDVFDDINSNYYAKTWWFVQQPGQHAPAWVALGPENPLVGVNDEATIPLSIELFDNYPNPFNPSTTIKYSVNVISDVTLSVYNILGETVSVMKKTNVQPGFSEFSFDAGGLSSGVYLYQLNVKNLSNSQVINTRVNKMVLLK